ncbi:MAG: hypothetical protein KDK89_20715 [Alphaproteobacteria bacterium]|nr:hypothetical protein [Alphaproteobacteria bacterium]
MNGSPRRRVAAGAAMTAAYGAWAAPALAHTSERGNVMLMPTGLFITGGALVVLASAALAAAMPLMQGRGRKPPRLDLGPIAGLVTVVPSLASLALVLVLVAAGFAGPTDPTANPLPGVVWKLWWTGLTIVVLFTGNLWAAVNPWTGLLRLMGRLGLRRPPLAWPAWLGLWPAVLLFFGFVWLELIYETPQDPQRLAIVVSTYLAVSFVGGALFGSAWFRSAECFSVYFRMVSRLSPVQWREEKGRLILELGLPGFALLREGDGMPGTRAFILLALASVSFDGLLHTFFWVVRLGLNPLEYPGRSVVVVPNTLGLAGTALALGLVYALAVWCGSWMAGGRRIPGLVWSLVPIAFAYHLAHNLPDFPVTVPTALKALSDPFGLGADLLGTSGLNPPASVMMDYHVATTVYQIQVAIIVAGHVMAVIAAHVMALRTLPSAMMATVSQVPLNAAMVLYTMFGLWLLSTPIIG